MSAPWVEKVAEHLAEPGSDVLLHGPIQSGLRRALTPLLASYAEGGSVLILTASRLAAESWRQHLWAVLSKDRVNLLNRDFVLRLAEDASAPSLGKVSCATVQLFIGGPGQSLVGRLRNALLVVDVPMSTALSVADESGPGRVETLVRTLAEQADRTLYIQTVEPLLSPPSWMRRPVVIDLAAVPVPFRIPPVRVIPYAREEADAEQLLAEVAQFLGLELEPATRMSRGHLYSLLVERATVTETGDPPSAETRDVAWRLAELVEGLGPDPRLASLTKEVRGLRHAGPVRILTLQIADAEYLGQGLRDAGVDTVVATPSSPPAERASLASKEDTVVVASRGVATDAEGWVRAAVVLPSDVRSIGFANWLAGLMALGLVTEVVILVPEGSTSLIEQAIPSLLEMRANPAD